MRWVSVQQRSLRLDSEQAAGFDGGTADVARTNVAGWDALAPHGGFARGGVHEFLFDARAGHAAPSFAALLVARGMLGGASASPDHIDSLGTRRLVWCDDANAPPHGATLYPPALAWAGVPLDRLHVLRPRPADVTWAVAECLGCAGVGVVVATLPADLSRVEARRLQLAAERGGGAGVMFRALGHGSRADIYAAATRWIVAPAPGDRLVQRWTVQLLHGHGGQQGQSILLEARRAHDFRPYAVAVAPDVGRPTLPLHSPAALADRTARAAMPRASA